jgi:methylmalonyl-CoA mutase N-terminal domain/subunit
LPCILELARKRGYDIRTLRGTAQNDILKEFIGRGTWVYPVQPSIQLVADTIEFCAREAPKYSPVSVCGYHIRESGADPVQEMAYAFCIARVYADEVIARGLPVDEFAGRLSYNFNIFGNIFEQVCSSGPAAACGPRSCRSSMARKSPRLCGCA